MAYAATSSKAALAQRHCHRSVVLAWTARSSSIVKMAYSVRWAALRTVKWAKANGACGRRDTGPWNAPRKSPSVCSAAKVSVDNQNITVIHRSGGSQYHNVWQSQTHEVCGTPLFTGFVPMALAQY